MKESTFQKLLDDYNKLKNPRETTAIKYEGTFNDVQINIYFDAWDEDNYNFQLILQNKPEYYLNTLNIYNNDFSSKYLPKLPDKIKEAITVNYKLEEFYIKLEHIIENNNCSFINYNSDKIYSNTSKYNPPEEKMYLKTLSHKNMTKDMKDWLELNTNISLNMINKIRNSNLTFVRTSDINKRKKLNVILANNEIQL